MILVDTSVWVEHFRSGAIGLETLLLDGRVVCHPFIIGELACGNLANRTTILALLQDLPMATRADDDGVLQFIEAHGLMGKGLGYIDIHLLMSALLTRIPLWTRDRRLHEVSRSLLPSQSDIPRLTGPASAGSPGPGGASTSGFRSPA